MRARKLIAIFLCTAMFGLSAAPRNDFHVVAHFGSGHYPVTYDDPTRGAIGAWYLRIDGAGRAKIEVIRNSPGKKTIASVKYSKQELQRISETIVANKFFDLPSLLDGGLTHVPSYSLKISMNGKSRRVAVIGPGAFRNKKLLKRFTAVWLAVCRKMPPELDDGATLDLKDSS
jgi:hypothetical protein